LKAEHWLLKITSNLHQNRWFVFIRIKIGVTFVWWLKRNKYKCNRTDDLGTFFVHFVGTAFIAVKMRYFMRMLHTHKIRYVVRKSNVRTTKNLFISRTWKYTTSQLIRGRKKLATQLLRWVSLTWENYHVSHVIPSWRKVANFLRQRLSWEALFFDIWDLMARSRNPKKKLKIYIRINFVEKLFF